MGEGVPTGRVLEHGGVDGDDARVGGDCARLPDLAVRERAGRYGRPGPRRGGVTQSASCSCWCKVEAGMGARREPGEPSRGLEFEFYARVLAEGAEATRTAREKVRGTENVEKRGMSATSRGMHIFHRVRGVQRVPYRWPRTHHLCASASQRVAARARAQNERERMRERERARERERENASAFVSAVARAA